jgi:DNA-binding NarL/FixJ family response regulator
MFFGAPMHIVLADDHPLIRDGLRLLLTSLDTKVVLYEAASFDEAVAAVRAAPQLDLVLLDLKMPGMDGILGVREICRLVPSVPVVVLSGQFGRDEVHAVLRAGARGFIPKAVGASVLTCALRLVLAGEVYAPASLLLQGAAPPMPSPPSPASLAALSPREREILAHLIEGETNKEIARRLDLQEITVKIHLRNVYRKIGAANRAMAVRIALSAGWSAAPPAAAE